MQFAGQRTSLEFEPLGEPVNLLVKMSDDTLPSPSAIMVTGITPQVTQADGISEAELASFLAHEVFTAETIAVGYNNVHFDDEFLRYLFWRNFYDPYEWHWRDGRSRWDLLDVVRMVRALRPEGIEWPVDAEGKPTNRLELLTKANGLEHHHAHDALSDVEATIQTAQLLHERQPAIFDFLLSMRDKRAVAQLVDPDLGKPLVYTAGQFSSVNEKTTVVLPLAVSEQGKVLLFDLRYNLGELLAAQAAGKTSTDACVLDCAGNDNDTWRQAAEGHPARFLDPQFPNGKPRPWFYPVVSTLSLNRCPAVAPLGVLEKEQGWERLKLTPAQIQHNWRALRAHPEYVQPMIDQWRASAQGTRVRATDPESALYDGFLSDQDARACGLVRGANARQLVGLDPQFADPRLKELYLHYRARNFRQTLDETEAQAWEKYRTARLSAQAPHFLRDLERAQRELAVHPDEHKAFLVEELTLWYQSLGSVDWEE